MKNAILSLGMLFCFSIGITAQVSSLGLVGDWPFDGNANDYSGNNNNGTVNGATPTADRFGIANHAYQFNGISNIIVVPNAPSIDMSPTDDFTIAYWMRVDPADLNGTCVAKHHTGYWNGYLFLTKNTNDPGYCTATDHLFFYTAAGAQQDACSNSAVCTDSSKWTFITGVHIAASNQTILFVNAVQQTDIGQSSGSISNQESLSFGGISQCNCGYFSGALDGVKIYKRILTQNEINQLYTENPASVNQLSGDAIGISTFPNPTNGLLNLSYLSETSQTVHVTIFDNLGNAVYSEMEEAHSGKNENVIDLSNLANGIYQIQMEINDGCSFGKIVVLRN